MSLVDLLDRVLGAGVVITGEVTLSIAGVDLVYVSLRALVASAATVAPRQSDTVTPRQSEAALDAVAPRQP
ncbi:gas vesicle protein [Dactylosporangium sp. CA-139114]|uniref:gas vesicle protein n=1 Tax=Dactylosporangium sp. CA-139114 TaxID=3239931 RepID=UPI003D95707B